MKCLRHLDSLKKRAWAIKKKYGLRHQVALDLIACHLGYKCWSALVDAFKREEITLPMVRDADGGLKPWAGQFHQNALPGTFAELYGALTDSRGRFVYLD